MTIFLFFVVVVLYLVFRSKKNTRKPHKPNAFKPTQAKPPAPKPVTQRPYSSTSIPGIRQTPPSSPAPPNPAQIALDLAAKHFGWEWEDFLKTKAMAPGAGTDHIQKMMAASYRQMQQLDLRDFLYSLINTSTSLNYESTGKLIARKPYIYHELHSGVYDLAVRHHLTESDIIQLLNQLVTAYRDRKKTDQPKPTPPDKSANIPAEATQSLPVKEENHQEGKHMATDTPKEPVAGPELVQVPVAAVGDVIDILPGDLKLNFGISFNITTTSGKEAKPVENNVSNAYVGYNIDDYKLGTLYKEKMGLSPQEVTWLNKFTIIFNQFNGIDACAIAISRLYLSAIKKMVRRFANAPVGLQRRMDEIKEVAYKFSLQEHGHWQYYDHNEVKARTESDLYYTVYKKAENAVRSAWHCSHITPGFYARTQEAIDLFETHIEQVLDEVILDLSVTVPEPDDATEIILNQQSTTRWKRAFEQITGAPGQKIKTIAEAVHHLAKLNKKNPSVENIYYEAAKFLVTLDKVESLNMYLYYIKANRKSGRGDYKPYNKTNQKQLFSAPAQQDEFQAILDEFILYKDLRQALKKTPAIYQLKRKRIMLDSGAVTLAGHELSGTVEVLNKYLNEDDDFEPPVVKEAAVGTYGTDEREGGAIVAAGRLSATQIALLSLFKANGFCLPSAAVNDFALQHGAFKNQLVESVNDMCMDELDDLLIEENEDDFTIDPDYFIKIYSE